MPDEVSVRSVDNGTLVVSVIMPVYNGARYLVPAINSLLAQTFLDWELIAVDDGSTDETPEILRGYRDPRIRTVWQPNAGEAAARNRGLSMARGTFVAFLDADDLYLPNALADMTSFLNGHRHFEVALSDGYVCKDDETTLSRLSDHRPAGVTSGRILESLVLQPTVVTVPVCTMTRRGSIGQARFDTTLGFGTDWDFWIRLARTASFGFLDTITCKYRVHISNMTRMLGQRRWRDDLAAGRMKTMTSPWFGDLSLPTRRQFVQHFLTTLLTTDAVRQQAVLEDPACRAFPAADQADLWRRVAIDHIVHRGSPEFANECLRRAVTISATDTKSQLVRQLVSLPGGCAIAPVLLSAWSRLHAGLAQLRTRNGRTARAVTSSLLPVGD